MNSRNLEYTRPENLKRSRRIADNKLLSKKVLLQAGIPVPRLISQIRDRKELEKFDWNLLPNSFVLKPNRGFGGEGILVAYGKSKNRENVWIKADGSLITKEDIINHIQNILDGSFSLSNIPDIAFFEERLRLLKLFKPYVYRGIPDVRIIVYNKVPVMAMLRLPTKESGGRANLQQGAVGIGIDLASGVTTTSVRKKNEIIEYLPNTRLLLSGIKIPYWSEILRLAVKAQEVSKLGFLGADVAIDKERGPVFLELNARPGLSIQIANLAGLRRRLERIAGLEIRTVERGVRVGMNLFGGEVEEEIEDISGKKIIGPVEKIKLIGKDGKEIEVEAKIDTGAGFSSIDRELAEKIGFVETIREYEKLNINYETMKKMNLEDKTALLKNIPDLADTAIIHSASGTTCRPMVEVRIVMNDLDIPAKVSIIERSHLKFPVIIGRKNLDNFLIDISKKYKK